MKEKMAEKQKRNERKKKDFGLLNSLIQTICKNRTKIISALEWNGSRMKLF
jgi:hypothetical protein